MLRQGQPVASFLPKAVASCLACSSLAISPETNGEFGKVNISSLPSKGVTASVKIFSISSVLGPPADSAA